MSIEDMRVALTVVTFLVFIGIGLWAYSRRRRKDFEEAANLPFTGHDFDGRDDPERSKGEGSK
ncbi:MAG: cbb3-type cytochrome oxidase subunit 3 [Burkholderiaceae bacterium]